MRRRSRIVFLFAIVILYLPFSNAMADNLVIAADRWCPYNCAPNTAKPGYMVEIAQRTLAKAGHTVEYKLVPWARAVKEGREGKLTGIIGAYVDDAPDFVFPKNELAMSGDVVFVLKEKNWTYRDISSLPGMSIGVIKGYAYSSEELNDYIKKYGNDDKKIQFVFGDNPCEANIRKLAAGRMDAVIESPAVFWYTATQMKMKDKFKSAGSISRPKEAYIAFSPANAKSKEYARILSDGIDAMRKSGELKTILEKYGLDDWR